MNICYVGYFRIPTEKAHGYQVMKMCEAFASQGNEVSLIIPARANAISQDPFEYYGIKKSKNLQIHLLDVGDFDLYHGSALAISLKNLWYGLRFLLQLLKEERRFEIFYTRYATIAWWLGITQSSRSVVYEAHGVPAHFLIHRFLLRKVSLVVAITQGIMKEYRAQGFEGEMIVEADAVDPLLFQDIPSKQEIRTSLGLPFSKKIVAYAGSFSVYAWKGVDILIEASHFFPPDTSLLLVGGSKSDLDTLSKIVDLNRTILIGRVSQKVVAHYLSASDVLVLPNKKGDPASERYTSPLKLFEYMASGTPIVASDLASIREVLDAETAVLVPPNDSKALAEGIAATLSNESRARERSSEALARVLSYTWEKRAIRILDVVHDKVRR